MPQNPKLLQLDRTTAVSITGPTSPLPQINVYPAQFFLVQEDYRGVITILGQVVILKWDNFGVPDPDDHSRFLTHSFNIAVVLQKGDYTIGYDTVDADPPKPAKGAPSIYLVNADGTTAYLGYVNMYGLEAHVTGIA